jgi:hypothetical protein
VLWINALIPRSFSGKKAGIIKLMQPQMPYGAPQGPDPGPYPGPPQTGQPSQPPGPNQQPSQQPNQQPYAGQPNYPYPNQQGGQYPQGNIPGILSQYPQSPQQANNAGQPAMPQYQPPGGFHQKPGRPAPLPPPPPIKKTPYDFFMQQKHPTNTKMPIPGPRQAGFRGRIVWIAGAGIVVMLVITLISAFSPKDTTSQDLITLAQTQQEVVRVCDQGVQKAKEPTARNLAINCSTSVQTDQSKLLSYLAGLHVKVKTKQLGVLANHDTDKALSAATASSSYDTVFKTVSIKQLTIYMNLIQQQLASGQLGTNAQALLNAELAGVKILIDN